MGDKEYRLRFTTKALISIEQTGRKYLDGQSGSVPVFNLLDNIHLAAVQTFLLQKGLEWEHPDIDFDKAAEIRDAYMEAGDLDDGEKFKNFVEILATAINYAYGIDLKKTKSIQQNQKTGAGKRLPGLQ